VSPAIANRATPGLLAVALFAAAVNFGAAGRVQSPSLSRNQLVAAAAAYVSAYQQQFAFLIADERTVQEASGEKGPMSVPLGTRTTRGEIFITFLEGRRHWTTVRDVAEVDGVPVVDRVDLPTLLSRDDADTVARRLWALNARYNIGGVIRNFNDPMLALLPLSDAHRSRFAFDVEGTDHSGAGVVLATLSFRERERPTLVRQESGGPAYAKGTITLDAATGSVRHTRFRVSYNKIEAELVTEFSREDRLGLWVPSTFSERYTAKADGLEDVTTSTSTYTNYRRFEARGRLLGLSGTP
jgi:hypothetical protein